jgi:hypothetical protein
MKSSQSLCISFSLNIHIIKSVNNRAFQNNFTFLAPESQSKELEIDIHSQRQHSTNRLGAAPQKAFKLVKDDIQLEVSRVAAQR